MESLFSLLSTVSIILGVVGQWMIFQDNGEAGWKALIPFYSAYIFAKTFFEERLGKKLMWSQLILFIIAIPLVVFLAFVVMVVAALTIGSGLGVALDLVSHEDFWQNIFGTVSNSFYTGMIGLSVLFVIAFIFTLIYHIKLHYRYNTVKGAPIWFMLIWIIAPGIGYFYYGLKHEANDASMYEHN